MGIILLIFLKSFFHYIFNLNSKYSAAFTTLFRSHTFKVPDALAKDYWIGIRYLKKSLQALSYSGSKLQRFDSDILIYDGDYNQKTQREDYLKAVLKRENFSYTTPSDLPGVTPGKRLFFLILYSPLFTILIAASMFSRNRRSIALVILTITQNYLLLHALKKSNVKEVYYFFPFENDANFNGLVIMKSGLKVIKVPGPNSLNRFHQFMIADKVALCTGFQIEQAEKLKIQWHVKQILKWPLYDFQEILAHENKKLYEYKIGLISSGIWRRQELGLQSLEKGDFESEITLINWLKDYFDKSIQNRLFIFLHPIEKKDAATFEKAKRYYSKKFEGVELFFMDSNAPSYKSFQKVEITVASHSTANLQRLYLGYKVIYTPVNFVNKLFESTKLERLCCYSKTEFYNLIDSTLGMSEDEYFNIFEIENYRGSKSM